MRTFAVAAIFAACVGVSGAAPAADLSLKDTPAYEYSPVAIWTGLYLGGHIGGAWGGTDVTDTFNYSGDPTVKSSLNASGLTGGVQLGYNLQRGKVVFGFEADLGGLDISGDKSSHLQDQGWILENNVWKYKYNLDAKYSISSGMYGDITGRLGITPTNNSLLYLKGGAAFMNVDYSSHYVGNNYLNTSTFDFSHSDTLWGWTIGAGVEYALSPRISLKAEYQHLDFGSTTFHDSAVKHITGGCGSCNSSIATDAEVSPTVDAVTVGINYHLNGGAGALK